MKTFTAVLLGGTGVGKSHLLAEFLRDVPGGAPNTIEGTLQPRRKRVTVDDKSCQVDAIDASERQIASNRELMAKDSTGFLLVFDLTNAASLRELNKLRKLIFSLRNQKPPSFPIERAPPKLASQKPVAGGSRKSVPVRPHVPHRTSSVKFKPTIDEDQEIVTVELSGGFNFNPSEKDVMAVPLVLVGTKFDLKEERQVSRDMATRLATVWGIPYFETSSSSSNTIDTVFEGMVRGLREHQVNPLKKLFQK